MLSDRFSIEHIGQFIINHWVLWLTLLIVLVAIFINERLAQLKRAKEISPNEVVSIINDGKAVIIDLRDQESYRKGHIINAVHATVEDFHQNRMDKYKKKELVLVCAQGLQSRPLAAKLRQQGFNNPLVLAGGLTAWQSADLPLVKGK